MKLNKGNLRGCIFWFTILFGLILPIAVLTIFYRIKDAKTIDGIIKDICAFYFRDYTDLGFLFWFFQSLIFIALAFLVKSKIKHQNDATKSSVIEYSEAMGAWILTVIFSVIANIDVLVSTSSTAVIEYIFIPFYEVIMILIGYALGFIIGKVILWAKNRDRFMAT